MDNGVSWSSVSPNFNTGTLRHIAIAPSDPDVVFAMDGFDVWKTVDGGSTWNSSVSPPGYTDYYAIHSNNPDSIWAASGTNVYFSDDGGNSWTDVSGTLPNISMNSIVYQKNSDDGVYVGADVGIFYKDNSLSDWILFSTDLPNVRIDELEIDECQNIIRAATFGRGLWESPLYCDDVGNLCCDLIPTPQISPSGEVSVCQSDTQILIVAAPVSGYQTVWYRDGMLIPMENDTFLYVDTAGNYQARYSEISGNCISFFSNTVEATSQCIWSICTDFSPTTNQGPGNTTIINIVDDFPFPDPDSTIEICVTVDGDIGSSSERFNILDEDGVNQGMTNTASDCSGPSSPFCFSVTPATFTNWTVDDTIQITLDPISTAINPTLCSVNEGCATLYLIPYDGFICPDSITINDDPIPDSVYHASEVVTSIGRVSATSDVTFKAGNAIFLKPGFTAQSGGYLHAAIEDCLPPPAPPSTPNESTAPPQELSLSVEENGTIYFTLPQNCYGMHLELLNAKNEREGYIITQGVFEKGMHAAKYDRAGIPSGTYRMMLYAGTEFVAQEFVVK